MSLMEWLTGGPAGWQEWAAALIVAVAVVSLYRHFRGMFGAMKPGGGVACRGCAGECEDSAPVNESVSKASDAAGATSVSTTPVGMPR